MLLLLLLLSLLCRVQARGEADAASAGRVLPEPEHFGAKRAPVEGKSTWSKPYLRRWSLRALPNTFLPLLTCVHRGGPRDLGHDTDGVRSLD